MGFSGRLKTWGPGEPGPGQEGTWALIRGGGGWETPASPPRSPRPVSSDYGCSRWVSQSLLLFLQRADSRWEGQAPARGPRNNL